MPMLKGLVKAFSQSTFHYGSIKIAVIFTINVIVSKSTFHYGSIKIR